MNQYPLDDMYSAMPAMPTMPYGYQVCYTIPQLAHAYVPFQFMNCVYPPMQGLDRATIFPELDRPYGLDPEYTVDA